MNKQFITALLSVLILTGCSGTMPKLGLENNRLQACPSSPNCVSSQAGDHAHFIKPLETKGSTLMAKNALLGILEALPRAKVTHAEDAYIRAEFTSRVFRFVDDAEFLILETKPDEVLIHVRSASRVGRSDFGVNRKRVEHIRHKMTSME